jgi:hypothetical protein
MIVTQTELAEIFGVCTRNIWLKTMSGDVSRITEKGKHPKYDVKEAMKEWYGDEDWKHYYNKYLGKKIAELTGLMESGMNDKCKVIIICSEQKYIPTDKLYSADLVIEDGSIIKNKITGRLDMESRDVQTNGK